MPIHVDSWLKRAEADYYMMFVRAWIPFNAWFMDAYFQANGTRPSDRQAINYLKANNNRFRDKIVNLLNGHDAQTADFFFHLSHLHTELQAHAVYNKGERVGLNNTHIANNSVTVKTQDFGRYKYKCEKLTVAGAETWRSVVMNKATLATLHQFDLSAWNMHDFENHPDFLAIGNDTKKNKLKECFREINPKKPAKIILPMRVKKGLELPPLNSIAIDAGSKLYFKNNAVEVAQVLIEILYKLRCLIFHGELEPLDTYLGIYEHAYHIQRILIKELV